MPFTQKPQHIPSLLRAIENSVAGSNLTLLREARRQALDASLPVYLVGGPVRDVLLGAPVRDLDFVVEGDGPALARRLVDAAGGEVVVHARFGTATIVLNDCRVDVVTARREVYPHPGALPEVFPGAIYDDLARRDFSINALALPLQESHPGVLDPHRGVDDIGRGVIRILHQNSFVDDPTRILRAIRYEQRFGFTIEEETLSQLQKAIREGCLNAVSADRLRHELERMLEEEKPALPLRRALELGVLAAIHPSLKNAQELTRLAANSPFADTLGKPLSPLAYLAALVYPLNAVDGEGVIHRLNMPGSWARVVRDTIELREQEPGLATPYLSASQLYRMLEGRAEAAIIAVSRVVESAVTAQRLTWYLDELRFVSPILNGRDLLTMGVPSGPLLGRILRQLLEAKLDQQVSTEADERRLAQEILAGQGGP